MWIVVYLITAAVLFGFGSILNWLWNAGLWWLVITVAPTMFAVVYWFSPQHERDEFIADVCRLLRRSK